MVTGGDVDAEWENADREWDGVTLTRSGRECHANSIGGAREQPVPGGDLQMGERPAPGDPPTRALEEEPVRRLIRGQQVERRSQRATRPTPDRIAHARVPVRSCVMPPES